MTSVADKVKALALGDRFVRRNPLAYPVARGTFDRLAPATLDERRRLTEARLRWILRAASHTPYGRRTDAGDRIGDWPLLVKGPVRDDPGEYVRRRRLTVGAATSGTTGVPLSLTRSLLSVSAEQAALDFLLALRGIVLASARVAVLRAEVPTSSGNGRPVYWRDTAGGRRRLFSSNDLSRASLDAFVEGLEEFEPDCLLAYPSSLDSLCFLLEERGLGLEIPATLTSSEVLPDQTRAIAERQLRTRVIDLYGQAERVSLAYSVRKGEYRFLPGYGHTELVLVDRSPEGDVYEIVGTSLWNASMALIRYRTGDLVVLPRGTTGEEIEEIRYGLRPFGGILGRRSDYLVAPNGARIIGVNHIPRGVEHVVRMQIVQEARDSLRVLVLAGGEFDERDRDRIRRNLADKLPREMRFTIETVPRLEHDSRARTPFLIRRPGVEFPRRFG
jgi:phenylacetate-coenzyme A ligase PaaK-like adenylate-forming protein